MEQAKKSQTQKRDLLSEVQMKLKRCIRACERFEEAETEEELLKGGISKLELEN